MEVSKTKSSFYRRLYVAWLIDSQTASSVPALTDVTGMPRRTAQDTIAALADLDIVCEFEQQDGARNHAGRYLIQQLGSDRQGLGWPAPGADQAGARLPLTPAHADVRDVIFKVRLAFGPKPVLLIK